MSYIHENPNWPHLSWDWQRLGEILARTRYRQGLLLGKISSLEWAPRNDQSALTLLREVCDSSKIEGETLSEKEVRSSLARRLGLDYAGLPLPSRKVDGMVAMALDATHNASAPMTAERLCQWHTQIFPQRQAGLHRMRVGGWRTEASGPMQVVSGPYGREHVHFQAPPADRVPGEMQQFLNRFETPGTLDPFLHAGLIHLHFLTIHPFEDGNGRIARALTDLLLSRADGYSLRFYSMSNQIEQDREAYYDQLECAQKGTLDITSWLAWFLGCLERSLIAAESSLADTLRLARFWRHARTFPLNARQMDILNRLHAGFQGKLTSGKYAKIQKCSQDTALRDLQSLVAHGLLQPSPEGGRSRHYLLSPVPEAGRI